MWGTEYLLEEDVGGTWAALSSHGGVGIVRTSTFSVHLRAVQLRGDQAMVEKARSPDMGKINFQTALQDADGDPSPTWGLWWIFWPNKQGSAKGRSFIQRPPPMRGYLVICVSMRRRLSWSLSPKKVHRPWNLGQVHPENAPFHRSLFEHKSH